MNELPQVIRKVEFNCAQPYKALLTYTITSREKLIRNAGLRVEH